MTKKIMYLIIVLLLSLTLAACGCSAEASKNEGADSNSEASDNQEVPQYMELILGTVLLEETEHAVDTVQAAELLPLWKVLGSLSNSDTGAQAEVDAVIASIEDAMTSEQIAAMEGMELTMTDTAEVMEILGVEADFGGRFGEMDPEMQATMEAMRESGEGPPEGFGPGQGPGGGMGRDGQGIGGNPGMDPEMMETAMAERSGALGRGFGINTQLLDAIITFLEAKIS
jgi:hypothetical protein